MLDEFRSTSITWDKATSRIYSPVTANASDENGRKLVVQIVNGGQVEDLTGATLHLYWETRDKAHDGLDVFDAVDLKKGEFELSYTTGMLSNQGVLNANLVLIDTVGRVVSERFKITVSEGIDNDAIQSENSFSSLTQALIDISNLEQNYAPRLNDLTAQLQQTEIESKRKRELEDLSSTVLAAIQNKEGETTFNLLSIPQNYSVTGEKMATDLTKVDDRNLLDENKAIPNGFYSLTSGLWQNDASQRSTALISCAPGEVFFRNSYVGYHLTYWDSDDNFVSGAPMGTGDRTFIVPYNDSIAGFRFSIPKSSPPTQTLISKGPMPPDRHVIYRQRVLDIRNSDLRDEVVTENKLSNTLTKVDKTNLFNEDDCILGGYFRYNDGVWVSSTSLRSSGLILGAPGEVFLRHNTGGATHVTFWTGDGNFVSGSQVTGVTNRINIPNDDSIIGFRIAVDSSVYNQTMIVKGTKLPNRHYVYKEKILTIERENINPRSITMEKLSEKLEKQITGNQYVKPYPRVSNPIMTKSNVTDRVGQSGVADPFIVMDKGRYHLFFEIIQGKNPNTGEVSDEIGHAYSDDLTHWTYTQVVLSKAEHGHRSAYPHVFKADGEWYMLPDSVTDIKLYKAKNFPLEWEFQLNLIQNSGVGFTDTNVFKFEGVWYLTTSGGVGGRDGLSLYYNTSGDFKNTSWTFHSVIIPNNGVEKGHRGAGNPSVKEGYVLIPVQVTPTDTNVYGEYTKLYKLGNLSPTTIQVADLGKLTEAQYDGSWQDTSAHHISHAEYLNGNIYAVDGTKRGYSIGLFVDN